MNLGLAADELDEAADGTLTAVASGRLVPSNYWRVAEVVFGIEGRHAPDAATVRVPRHSYGLDRPIRHTEATPDQSGTLDP